MAENSLILWGGLVLLALHISYAGASSNVGLWQEVMAKGCWPKSRNLALDCANPGVISIIWNKTFVGCNACHPEDCCPDDTKQVLVTENLSHLEKLDDDCNGQPSCSVEVEKASHCAGNKRYEHITYQCIQPVTKTNQATSQTTPVGTSTSTVTKTNQATSQTTPVDTSTSTDTAMIAVSVSLSLLLVLTVVVGYVCYRRGLAPGKGKNNEYLTTFPPSEAGGGTGQNRTTDTVFTVTDQSNTSSRYNTPNIYEQPIDSYAELHPAEYDNTNGLFTAEPNQEAGSEDTNEMASDPRYVQSQKHEDVPFARPATYVDVVR